MQKASLILIRFYSCRWKERFILSYYQVFYLSSIPAFIPDFIKEQNKCIFWLHTSISTFEDAAVLSLINENHSHGCSRHEDMNSFQVFHWRCASIQVFLYGWLRVWTSPSSQHFLTLHFSFTYACIYSQAQQATGLSLSLNGSHEGSAGRAQHQSQGPTLWRAF